MLICVLQRKHNMCTRISYMLLKSGIILCMHSANERWLYIVTSSLIGWAHTQNEHAECIEASTRWSPLCNFHFQIYFFDRKIKHFDSSRLRHDMETISTLLCEESSGFPYQRISNMELWCLLCCKPEQTVAQIVELPVIWDAMVLLWRHSNVWNWLMFLIFRVQLMIKHHWFR